MEWYSLTVAVVLVGAPVAFVVTASLTFAALNRNRRREAAELGPDAPQPRGLARLFAALAFGYAAAAAVFSASSAVGLVIALASRNRGEGVDIGLVRLPVPDSALTELPQSAIPSLAEATLGPGYFSEVTLWAPPISNGTAALYFAPAVITPLLHLVVAVGVATLARSIDRTLAFAPQLGRVATVVGWALIVLGTASEILRSVGIDRAGREVLADGSLGAVFGVAELDLTAATAGIAVLMMGALARRGLRLQRETAGLV